VLALYNTPVQGQFRISFRWLYWHDDVPASLSEDIPREPNQLFEHYSKQTFDAGTALGRIYLNSSVKHDVSQHSIRGKDGMPRIFLTCRHAVVLKGGKDVIQQVSDWKGQHDVSMTTMKRALSLLTKDPGLQRATMHVLQTDVRNNHDEASNGDESEEESSESEDDSTDTQHNNNDVVTVHSQSSLTQEAETPPSNFTRHHDAFCRKEDMFFTSDNRSRYYTSLTLPVCQKKWYDVQPTCSEWEISVGQTIAVASRDSSTLPYMNGSQWNPGNPWYPFTTPWVPAQVLALYHTSTGKHFNMAFRRLYWHDNVNPLLTNKIPRKPNQVFEYHSKQTVHVGMALGRIHLDSTKVESHSILGEDGMPRLFLTCSHGVKKKRGGGETLETVTDWKGQCSVPVTALERGLLLIHRPKLPQKTMEAMKGVRKEETNVDGMEKSDGDDERHDAITVQSSSPKEPKTPHSTDSTAASSSSLTNADPFYTQDGVSYYWSLQVTARKQDYAVKAGIAADQQWTLQVGDLVAVEHEDSSKPTRVKPWFPFRKPWTPAQVLALSHHDVEGYMVHVRWLYRYPDFGDLDDASKEVKERLHADQTSKMASKIVYEYEAYNVEDLNAVLGRVILTSNANPSAKFLNTVQGEDGIPQGPLICRSMLSDELDVETPIDDWNMTHTSGPEQLQRGVLDCLAKAKGLQDATLAMLDNLDRVLPSQASSTSPLTQTSSVGPVDEDGDVVMEEEALIVGKRRSKRRFARGKKRPGQEPDSSPAKSVRRNAGNSVHRQLFDETLDTFVKDSGDEHNEPHPVASPASVHADSVASPASTGSEDDDRIFIPKGQRPFHEDFASLRSYYSEIQVVPPVKNYAVPVPPGANKELWTVKMGDTVIVHYQKGAGKTHFGSANDGNKGANFPFGVAWAIAEVVTMWKQHESVEAMKNLRSWSDPAAQEDVILEIRWFYRKNELPGAAKTATISENAATHIEYEEIFETDLMDECEAKSLLAPAKLHESALRLGLSKMQQGMPLIDVHCCRFWSIHRKSLMPIGNVSGRIERGRMHSKYFGKGRVLNAAWRELNDDESGTHRPVEAIRRPLNWKHAFKKCH